MSAERALTVGIDARSLVGQPTGVGRYVKNLVRAMASIDASLRFRLYVPSLPADAPGGDGIEPLRVLPMPRGCFLERLDNVVTWNHIRLPVHLLRRPVDLLHCPHYTLPAVCPCPAVVTIHDITFDLHPEWYTRRARFAFSGFASASARKARHVLTVSECSRRDIIATYGLAPSRVTAVPLAPDPQFRRVEDPLRLEAVRRAYGLGEEYVLHVGSVTPRRNIGALLDAFAAVRNRAPHLTLALAGRVEAPSPPVEADVESRGLAGSVLLPGYVPPEDLPALYSGAALVAFPSLYEGFGLPVVEAMACGVPVIASDASCFPEVAGDAALLVDARDTGALAAGMWSLLSDASLRDRLVRRGLSRAAGFTWERTARETLAVYRRSLGEEPGGAAGAVA